MTLLIAVVVLAAGLVGAVRLLVRQADTAFQDPASLTRSPTPNDALACPAGGCAAAADLITAPVALPAAALAAKVAELARTEPRVTLAGNDDAHGRFVLVQRSLVFAFPDTVSIEIRPVDADHATLAMYSRSKYGQGDLGVNQARLRRWLGLLGVATEAAPKRD